MKIISKNKIQITFSFLLVGLFFLTSCSSLDPVRGAVGSYRNYTEIKGAIKNGRYFSPDGNFSCAVPELIQPGAIIKDSSNHTSDGIFGGVSFDDDFGTFLRVDWAEIPKTTLNSTNAPSEEALLDRFAQFQFYTYKQVSPEASLAYRTNLTDSAEQELFVVFFLPHGSTVAENGKRLDTRRASIISHKGNWIYAVTTQDSIVLSGSPPTLEKDCEQLKDKLAKFYEAFQFN